MSKITLPDVRNGLTIDQKIQYLTDSIYKMRKELEFALNGNLDEENVIRAGSVYAENIDTTHAKISAAQIGEIYTNKLVATDGSDKVVIDSDGKIVMTSSLFIMDQNINAAMGIFPVISTMQTSIIKAGDDAASYSRQAGKLTIGSSRLISPTLINPTTNSIIASESGVNTQSQVNAYGILTTGYLTVTGAKNCLQKTEHYGERLINAYETAEYYFGDIGSATIGETGEVVVSIDEVFQECVNTTIPYHVFTQVYSGTIGSIERQPGYFTVKGTPGSEFSWELKAKRRGFESDRLETFNPGEPGQYSNIESELNIGA